MKYCIVTLIEGEIAKSFNEIANNTVEKFSVRNLSKRIPSHVTLKYPFEADEIEIQKIEEKIAEIVSTKHSVNFDVNGFGYFDQETIYFDIMKNVGLKDFLVKCNLELGEFDEDRIFDPSEYHPHISVVRFLTPEIFPKVWEYVSDLNIGTLSGCIDNISILVKDGDIWKVRKTYRFTT